MADYLTLFEIALDEWVPQTLQELALVKQQVDAEWDTIALQQVQTCLINSAIGAEFLAILSAEEDPTHKSQAHTLAFKHLIFAALAGEAEAVTYLEERTRRSVGISPDTPAHFAPMIPAHIFADRAITTRLARRDAAYKELSRLKAERSSRMEGALTVADIRSRLPFVEYIRLLSEVDLMKKAEPAAFAAAKDAPVATTSEPSFFDELRSRRQAATKATETEPVSVHAPERTNRDDVAGENRG